jgi:hypothetical protein
MLDEVLPLWEKASDPANGRMFDASDYPALIKPYDLFQNVVFSARFDCLFFGFQTFVFRRREA